MASNFPASLDSFTNPSSTDAMDSVSVPHATQHSDLNDAVEALQAKVGADSSAVTTSLDYKVAQLEALGTWIDYSASQTFSGLTVGNGTILSYYAVLNDVVFWRGTFTLGSTSVMTGPLDVACPVTPVGGTGTQWPGNCRAGIASIFYPGMPLQIGTSFRMTRFFDTGTVIRIGDYSASAPASWGTGDTFQWWITYQAA